MFVSLIKKRKIAKSSRKQRGLNEKKFMIRPETIAKRKKISILFSKKSEGLVQSKPDLDPGSGINGLAHIKTDQSPLQKSKERQIRPDSGTNSRGPGANLRTA
jgi:hypothetical protein